MPIVQVDSSDTERLGGSVHWSTAGARFGFSRPGGGVPSACWITSNLTWLFPDNPALWRHLVSSYEEGRRPLVIARKVAIATFPLLKRLGGVALQLHHLYLPNSPESKAAQRAFQAGPPLRVAATVGEHTAIEQFLPRQSVTEDVPSDSVSQAIKMAQEFRLDDDANPDPVAALRSWANHSPIPLPAPWKAQITKYTRWMEPASVDEEVPGS
jgi:hypothetical protein